MLLVVIPAYNEEKTIGRVFRDLFEHGFVNVLVVDDGSSDQTAAIARTAGVTVLRHEINRGQGAALQTGDEFALRCGADAVVHFDADGQFSTADLNPALAVLKNGVDAVLGSRFLDNRSRIPWFKKKIILPISIWINFALTGVRLSDAHNGFRILSRSALEKIKITQDRMAHNSEIIRQCRRFNIKYAETPVAVKYERFGQGIGGGFKILWDWLVGKVV